MILLYVLLVLERCVQGYISQLTCLVIVKIRHARFATEQVRLGSEKRLAELKIVDGSARFFQNRFRPVRRFSAHPYAIGGRQSLKRRKDWYIIRS